MPPALALLLLLGLGARGGGGCLQCEVTVVEALKQLRWALIPQGFHLLELRNRAQTLLEAMEGPFFRDYSLNAFVGKVGLDHLELVVTFLKNETNTLQNSSLRDVPLMEELVALRERVLKRLKKALKSYELKACDRKTCHFLKEEVMDCLHCQKISPQCIKKKYCFVDGQPRMALRYRKERKVQNSAVLGSIAVVGLAALFLGVIFVSAITYRQNRKLLLQ